LGHGKFQLKHPFDSDYKIPAGSTGNLMDYADNATHIAKWQWDLIHDPGMIVRVFERDRDAEIIRYRNPITIKWQPINPPQLLDAKKELRYIAEAGYEEPGRERTSFFKLDDNSTVVARYQDPQHTSESVFKYEIKFANDSAWYNLNIHSLTDDCLSCDLTQAVTGIYMSSLKTMAQMLLIEDAYILITGDDFEDLESSRLAASTWIVAGIAGGKILKFVGYVAKEAFIGTKILISNTSKLYKLVKGSNGIRAMELTADEAAEVIAKAEAVAKGGRFTAQQIADYVKFATKNPDAKKVMLGMWDNGASTSYVIKAGKTIHILVWVINGMKSIIL
jgi:hypothetical protein